LKTIYGIVAMLTLTGVASGVHAAPALILTPESVPRMSIDDLKRQMAQNPNLVIVDVRTPHDWDESTTKIKGAIREDPSKMGSWIDKYPPSKMIVLYCK
jgi:hypothetical protein